VIVSLSASAQARSTTFCRLDRREGRDDDHRQDRVELASAAQQGQAVDLRHLEIGQEQVRPLGLEQRQRPVGIRRRRAVVAGPPQDARAVVHHVGLVVDDEDVGRHARILPRDPGGPLAYARESIY